MEWLKGAKGKTGEAAGGAYEQAGDTAEGAYEQAGDAADSTYDKASNPSETASSIASSFKPDSSIIWQGFLIYVLLAAAAALPWWAFVAAADYFTFLYPGFHALRYFALAYFGSWLVVYALIGAFWRQGTSWAKINIGLYISVLALASIPVIGRVLAGHQGTPLSFAITLVVVAIAGAASAIAQFSVLGIGSELTQSFTKACIFGSGVAGVFVFIVRVITKACINSTPHGLRVGAIIYFAVCALFVVLVIALFTYIHTMPAMSYYNSLNLGSVDTIRLLIQDENSVSSEIAAGAAIASIAAGRSSKPSPLHWGRTFGRVKLLVVAVAVTSLVTLCVFPGYLTEDVHSHKLGTWLPLLLVGTYAVFDLLGNGLSFYAILDRHSKLFGLAFSRLLLLALFVLGLLFLPGIVSSLVVVFLLTAILAFSNGYLLALITAMNPKSNPAYEAEAAAMLNNGATNFGVLVGAGLSWLFVLLT